MTILETICFRRLNSLKGALVAGHETTHVSTVCVLLSCSIVRSKFENCR